MVYCAVLLRYSRQLVGSCTILVNGVDHRSGTSALNGVHLSSEWADSAVLLRYCGQFVGSCTITARGWITGQVLVHLTVFIFVVSGRKLQFCSDTAGSWLLVVQ